MFDINAFISINLWQLIAVLLVTTFVQEFFIKPSVEMLKRYIRKGRSHIEKLTNGNGKTN